MQQVSNTLVKFFSWMMNNYFSEKRSRLTKIVMFPMVFILVSVGILLFMFVPPIEKEDLTPFFSKED